MEEIKWNGFCPKCKSSILKWSTPSWADIPDELASIEEADELDTISAEVTCETCGHKFGVECSPKNWYLKN